ncbi:hypothetical protein TNCV_4786111 [Trichonephila clavipes]|nr:hypothetical protein TNCV_4786111 [Trichonephila clavipes]
MYLRARDKILIKELNNNKNIRCRRTDQKFAIRRHSHFLDGAAWPKLALAPSTFTFTAFSRIYFCKRSFEYHTGNSTIWLVYSPDFRKNSVRGHPFCLPLPPIFRKDLGLDEYLECPHATQAIYIYKHPCLLRDSNPGLTAQQAEELNTAKSRRLTKCPGCYSGGRRVVFVGSSLGITEDSLCRGDDVGIKSFPIVKVERVECPSRHLTKAENDFCASLHKGEKRLTLLSPELLNLQT